MIYELYSVEKKKKKKTMNKPNSLFLYTLSVCSLTTISTELKKKNIKNKYKKFFSLKHQF